MTTTQFLMVNPLYDMSASFTDASTNIDYQANASRNFINLVGDISNVDVSNTLYEGKTYDPSLSLVQFVKKTKKNFLDSNVNTMLDTLLYWARNTSGQNKFPILETGTSGDSSEQQTLPQPVANPYFTSANNITTNSDWPDGSGFEITHSSSSFSTSYDGWYVFKEINPSMGWATSSNSDEWVAITYPSQVRLHKYVLISRSDSMADERYPRSWQLEASNGDNTWTPIGTLQTPQSPWEPDEVTEVNVDHTVQYSSYRILLPYHAGVPIRNIRYIQFYTSKNS